MDMQECLNLLKEPICHMYGHNEWDDSEGEVIPNNELSGGFSQCEAPVDYQGIVKPSGLVESKCKYLPEACYRSSQLWYETGNHSFSKSMHEINDSELVEVKGEEYDTPSGCPLSPALETLQKTGDHLFFKSMHEINDFELVEAKGEEYDTPSCPPLSPVPAPTCH